MFRVLNCLATEHDWRLVLLAGVVCFLASVAAISLLHRAHESSGRTRFAWLATAGAATGCGIWATHFIAMLAYEPGPAVAYNVGLTVLSLVAAIVLTTIGLAATMLGRLGPSLGGVVVGGGVAVMHYTGMFALEISGHVLWRADLVFASILMGMLLGVAAMVIATRRQDGRGLLAAALLLTLAIVSHHFTAMGAVGIIPDPLREVETFALSPTALALVIAGVAFAILGMSMVSALADQRIATTSRKFGTRIGQLDRALEETDSKMREQNVRMDAALNNMSQGLCMFDAEGRLVVCNQRYVDLYGLAADVVKPGVTVREMLQRRKDMGSYSGDADAYISELQAAIAKGKTASVHSELLDGRVIVVVNQPMPGGGWVATHEDITERRRAEERIAHLAHHDALTGLPNRAAFAERLDAVIEAAKAGGAAQFAVLCADLDRFKEVNDVFGHACGDALLQEAARRMQAAVPDAFVTRLGGDEFTLIVTEQTQPADAESAADRLLATFNDEMEIKEQRLRVGLSVGIAIYPSDGEDAATLLSNADAALYRAKAEGRGTFRFFEAQMDMRLRERRAMQHELRSAIENDELVVFYQPQARMDGGIIGFEALVRWKHPTRGLVPPNTFIPIAEESGLIIGIGEWVLRDACREAASWPIPLQIAINLSPVQFQHGDLPATVHQILLETGLAPGRLELEITEGVLIGDFSRAVSILRRLKSLGVRIAMDDFGTGYSSLSYLQAFPFDKIKIDRTFISSLETNPQSAAIVRAVIGLAQGLEVPVVAEGVETQDQRAFLTREACNEMQGFFIGRPRPIEDYDETTGRTTVPAPAPRMAAAG